MVSLTFNCFCNIFTACFPQNTIVQIQEKIRGHKTSCTVSLSLSPFQQYEHLTRKISNRSSLKLMEADHFKTFLNFAAKLTGGIRKINGNIDKGKFP